MTYSDFLRECPDHATCIDYDTKRYGDGHKGDNRWAAKHKTTVFGMVERGGQVRAKVVPAGAATSSRGTMRQYVLPVSTIFTDGFRYTSASGASTKATSGSVIGPGLCGRRGSHPDDRGFFGLLKNGIRGTYHSVSRKHLRSYPDEFAWREKHRADPRPMFWTILDEVRRGRLDPS
jgi:transposase-like protein